MGGYFGNLEVFSRQAFSTLLANLDSCYDTVDWKVGVHGGKYGPMGEDLFVQKCMDAYGVKKVEAFYLTTDGACEADRPEGDEKNKKYQPDCKGTTTPTIHPFKKPAEYFKCLAEAEYFSKCKVRLRSSYVCAQWWGAARRIRVRVLSLESEHEKALARLLAQNR